MHLKGGKQMAWHALLPYCRRALPAWLKIHEQAVTRREQEKILFPSEIASGRCYTCAGTGKRPVLKRDGDKRWNEGTLKCHHCDGTGKRWGLARQEVYELVSQALKAAKVPYTHPHVLRHSIISHMLDAGVPPSEVQDRVGHRNLQSTLNYARATPSYGDALIAKMQNVYGK
jgi:integrase